MELEKPAQVEHERQQSAVPAADDSKENREEESPDDSSDEVKETSLDVIINTTMIQEMLATVRPMAPYNTTQFLMDEHYQGEPGLSADNKVPSEEFLQRNFSGDLKKYHVERLQDMTKPELVQEYLELEQRSSQVEEENVQLWRAVVTKNQTAESFLLQLQELERELERLMSQTRKVLLQNRWRTDKV